MEIHRKNIGRDRIDQSTHGRPPVQEVAKLREILGMGQPVVAAFE
jgi:hypothetical protein